MESFCRVAGATRRGWLLIWKISGAPKAAGASTLFVRLRNKIYCISVIQLIKLVLLNYWKYGILECYLNINVNIAAGHNNSGLLSARCTVHIDMKNDIHVTKTTLARNQSLEFCFNDFSIDHKNIGYDKITNPTKRTKSEIFCNSEGNSEGSITYTHQEGLFLP